jgi:glycosyltransferase involved in cell wall biosynthesis
MDADSNSTHPVATRPKVSIILNVHNGAATLGPTLASIRGQTVSDWELIVWDDRSHDDSVAVIKRLADSRFRFFETCGSQAAGLGAARRMAMREARGDWIGFIDQDDLWTEDKLALQLRRAATDPGAAFICGRAIRFRAEGTQRDFSHRHEFRELPEGDIFLALFVDSCYLCISAVLFRREAIESVPAIPPEADNCPDYYLYLELAKRYRVLAVQEPVCWYRMHNTNMSIRHAIAIEREILWLLGRWADAIEPKLYRRRVAVHATLLAVQLLRSRATFFQGLTVLFAQGSIGYLLSRPGASLVRALRRRLIMPFWQTMQRRSPLSQRTEQG